MLRSYLYSFAFLLCFCSIQAQSTEQVLLEQSIEVYLSNLNKQFGIELGEFIIETEQTTLFSKLPKQIGTTTILLRTKAELQDMSRQKKNEKIAFFTIDIEKNGEKMLVDILDDGIQYTQKEGVEAFSYEAFGAGRACELIFDKNQKLQSIDCLLLATDPEK